MSDRRLVRVEELVGRRVCAADGRAVGRIEDVRAERRGEVYEVVEYRLGAGALLERFALVRRWFGRRPATLVARWDQIDVRRPEAPRLTCAVEDLRHE